MADNPALEVVYLPVDDLVPYERNSKKHPDDQIEQIATSISEFGNCDPIAIWHNEDGQPVIVEGHGRALALQKLGIENAPTISLDHLSDDERRAYSHVHNQTTLSSGLDDEILAAEIDELPEFDWEALGFELPEPEEEAEIPDAPLPEEVETLVHPGELWKLGSHYLFCGDCTDPTSIERVLAPLGEVADLLLTGPPYNANYSWHHGEEYAIKNDNIGTDAEYTEFLSRAFGSCAAALRPGASYYVWHGKTVPTVQALESVDLGLRQILIWVKNSFVVGFRDYHWQYEPCAYGWKSGASHRFFGGRNKSSVLRFDRPQRSPEHPTMKPVPLFADHVECSTRPGEVVLDPFAGSGTTALACEHLGRRAALIELDPGYCDVILTRWEELTGKTAERCE